MKIMVYEAPRKLKIENAADLPLNKNEVRTQTLYSGISHGTEMNVYRGIAPFFRRKKDPETNLFINGSDNDRWGYPIKSCDEGVWYMGYANVGKVIEAGKDVSEFREGDVLFSASPHQSQIVKPADQFLKIPDEIKPENAVIFTNLMTAYNGILDSNIKLGDTVVVSGLGVLGQLLVQMSKMSGAFQVIGIDLFEKRLEAAIANGADRVFNPRDCKDVALEIRKLTNNKGADLVIEVTGSQRALNEAIRIAAPDTTITALGWYQGQSSDLDLSEEFHHNRIGIKCSQTGGIAPEIAHMWNTGRKKQTCMQILQKLKLNKIVTNIIPYEKVKDAYEMIDNDSDNIIQVVLKY